MYQNQHKRNHSGDIEYHAKIQKRREMFNGRSKCSTSDFNIVKNSDDLTSVLPPLRSSNTLWSAAVVGRNPNLIVSEQMIKFANILFWIKMHPFPEQDFQQTTLEAFTKEKAEWKMDLVPTKNGKLDIDLYVEDVLYSKGNGLTPTSAEKEGFQDFVGRVMSCDYFVIESNIKGSKTISKLKLFQTEVEVIEAKSTAFRYDLLCKDHKIFESQLPVCSNCQRTGHNKYFCTYAAATESQQNSKKSVDSSKLGHEPATIRTLKNSKDTFDDYEDVSGDKGIPAEYEDISNHDENILAEYGDISDESAEELNKETTNFPSKSDERFLKNDVSDSLLESYQKSEQKKENESFADKNCICSDVGEGPRPSSNRKNVSHEFWKCDVFIKLSLTQRWCFARSHSYCFNCFSTDHEGKNCKLESRCELCKVGKHHSLLHSGYKFKPKSKVLSMKLMSCPFQKSNQSKEFRTSADRNCLCCGRGSHQIWKCDDFVNRTVTQRHHFAWQQSYCFNCLSPDHKSSVCKLESTCEYCKTGMKHHSLLHPENEGTTEAKQLKRELKWKDPESHPLQTKQKEENRTAAHRYCICCRKAFHLFWKCDDFIKLSPNNRVRLAQQHSLCFNCFSLDHKSSKCKLESRCEHCKKGKHHSLLHSTSLVFGTTDASNLNIELKSEITELDHLQKTGQKRESETSADRNQADTESLGDIEPATDSSLTESRPSGASNSKSLLMVSSNASSQEVMSLTYQNLIIELENSRQRGDMDNMDAVKKVKQFLQIIPNQKGKRYKTVEIFNQVRDRLSSEELNTFARVIMQNKWVHGKYLETLNALEHYHLNEQVILDYMTYKGQNLITLKTYLDNISSLRAESVVDFLAILITLPQEQRLASVIRLNFFPDNYLEEKKLTKLLPVLFSEKSILKMASEICNLKSLQIPEGIKKIDWQNICESLICDFNDHCIETEDLVKVIDIVAELLNIRHKDIVELFKNRIPDVALYSTVDSTQHQLKNPDIAHNTLKSEPRKCNNPNLELHSINKGLVKIMVTNMNDIEIFRTSLSKECTSIALSFHNLKIHCCIPGLSALDMISVRTIDGIFHLRTGQKDEPVVVKFIEELKNVLHSKTVFVRTLTPALFYGGLLNVLAEELNLELTEFVDVSSLKWNDMAQSMVQQDFCEGARCFSARVMPSKEALNHWELRLSLIFHSGQAKLNAHGDNAYTRKSSKS